MAMFGINKNTLTPEQLDEALAPLLARLDKLETAAKRQAEVMAELERQLREMRQQREVGQSSVSPQEPSASLQSASPQSAADSMQPHPTPGPSAQPMGAQTYYLATPTADGVFVETSTTEQVGKSIYQLRTEDGLNGQFIMLSTPDAIATATISVSQFVKPACRIEGNVHQLPRQIETLEEGTAQRDGTVWRVVRKARVVFR